MDINLLHDLEEMDRKYGGDEMYKILGPSSLGWVGTDSSRMYMVTSQLKQVLTLANPDIAKLQTGIEKSIGKYNRSYKQLDGEWEIVDIITKYPLEEEYKEYEIFTLVLYNRETNTYDMIEKPIAENLTEKFGFRYDTTLMNKSSIGDVLTDQILYKSTSYDENMNYRYGKNANVYYSTSSDTLEDAIPVRRGWIEDVTSFEVDDLSISVNSNDILINLYGDDNNYKTFPDIGEKVKASLICATRRINNNHLLHDFQRSALRELAENDTDLYCSKGSIVYDINVYYNGEEDFPDNVFHRQLKKYYDLGCQYAARMLEVSTKIKESGSNYTQNIPFFRSKYMHYNDKSYKWVNKDKAFGNIVLELHVNAKVGLEPGSKMAGRYGNKGVISNIIDVEETIADMLDDGTMTTEERNTIKSSVKIVDDSKMMYYIQDGKRVYADIIFNSSSPVRRLNSLQLSETEVNFVGEQVRYKMINAKTFKEKEELAFKFLSAVNSEQSIYFYENVYGKKEYRFIDNRKIIYSGIDEKFKFIKNIEEHGFYIIRPPHQPILYDEVVNLYKIFPDIKPVPLYIDLFGIKQRRIIRDGIIGSQYIIILKQNSNKNFSARSTYRVNRSNLPTKDIAKKTNRSSYGRTPVRLSEIYNLLSSVSGLDLAEYNIFLRSSALGRKSLQSILESEGSPLNIDKLKLNDDFTNSNADILAARLKAIGLRIRFSSIPRGSVSVYEDGEIIPLTFYGYTIMDTHDKRKMYYDLFKAFKNELKKGPYIETYQGERDDICWNTVFEDKIIKDKYKDKLTNSLKEILAITTKKKSDEVREAIRSYVIKTSSITTQPQEETSEIRRRGRRSNAEKEQMRQQELQRQAEDDENVRLRKENLRSSI